MKQPSTHWLDNTHAGDCLGLLQRMRDDGVRVQTCITSPPYFRLRSYLPSNHPDKPLEIGACETPERYIERLVQVFRAVREILADDGTLWIVIGDSYAGSRSARPGSTYIGGKHGVAQAAINRITPTGDIKAKDLLGIPWQLAFALRRDGWYLRQDLIWHKPNAMPESVTDRCTRAHEFCCPNARAITLTKRPSVNPLRIRADRAICIPCGNHRTSIYGYATTCTTSVRVQFATSAMYGRSPPAASRAVTLPSFHRA